MICAVYKYTFIHSFIVGASSTMPAKLVFFRKRRMLIIIRRKNNNSIAVMVATFEFCARCELIREFPEFPEVPQVPQSPIPSLVTP